MIQPATPSRRKRRLPKIWDAPATRDFFKPFSFPKEAMALICAMPWRDHVIWTSNKKHIKAFEAAGKMTQETRDLFKRASGSLPRAHAIYPLANGLEVSCLFMPEDTLGSYANPDQAERPSFEFMPFLRRPRSMLDSGQLMHLDPESFVERISALSAVPKEAIEGLSLIARGKIIEGLRLFPQGSIEPLGIPSGQMACVSFAAGMNLASRLASFSSLCQHLAQTQETLEESAFCAWAAFFSLSEEECSAPTPEKTEAHRAFARLAASFEKILPANISPVHHQHEEALLVLRKARACAEAKALSKAVKKPKAALRKNPRRGL